MADAAQTETTTTAVVTVNRGYPTSWQGLLKIFKLVCLFACLICAAIVLNRLNASGPIAYCLAISVLGFLCELIIFILYVVGVNRKWADSAAICSIVLLIYHLLMLIMMFAACILMTGWGYYEHRTKYSATPTLRAFNAFGILALAGFALEIYFNIIWMRGGPELAAFMSG